MLTLSKRALNITPSATMALTAKVAELKRQGVDIIKFNVGEPDFDTPAYIREACKQALDEGKTRYSAVAGVVEVREAVCEKLKRDNGIAYAPAEICFSAGAKNALFNTLLTIVDDGDEVILPTPCWVSYVDMVKLAGGVPVLVPCKEDEGFDLDLAAIEAAVTPRTKAVLFNTPNNPTGAVYTEQTLRRLAELALKYQFYLVADEVYEKLIYDGARHFSVASISDEVKQITFTANALSKAYAMTGWRAGYVAGPQAVIAKIVALQSHSLSNVTTFVQYASIAALLGPSDEVDAMVAEFDRRRQYVVGRLNDMGFACQMPKGAFYVMPNVSSLFSKKYQGKPLRDSDGVAAFVLEAAHCAMVPGAAFFAPDNIRVSYSNSMENLKQGLDQLQAAVNALE